MYTVERTADEVLTLRHDDVAAGWEQRYLLISDVHFDSPYCDRKLLTRHLELAKAQGAGVLCIGDWFDAMGGKQDRRSTKNTARDEDKHDNYFDMLVDHSAEYLAPYTDNLVMLSKGNHETAILKHNETDLLERLCRELGCQCMGYSGWVRSLFQNSSGGARSQRRIYFHHGAGGGGPVTRGTINANRRAASIDADVYISGHIHEAWVLENVVYKLNEKGRVFYNTQMHCQLPTYKQEHGHGGYHDEKQRPPKPLGGYWLVFYYDWTRPGNVGQRFERAN